MRAVSSASAIPFGKSEATVLARVLRVRGRELPRCARLATTIVKLSVFDFAIAGSLDGELGRSGVAFTAPPAFGHLNWPFWLSTTWNFSLSDMLPRSAFTDLQQATQFSSLLLPPFELAKRCSTLASAFGSGCLQKKQRPPCANMRRSRGVVGIRLLTCC